MGVDATVNNAVLMEKYNLKYNNLQCYIHFCSTATNLQIRGAPSVL